MSSSRNHLRRKKIFELYSQNFHLTKRHIENFQERPGFEVAFVCPICLRLFNEEGLDQKYTDALTLEDVPPKSLGGKPIILTCKICNNSSGHRLDGQLLKQRHVNSFLQKEHHSKVHALINFKNSIRNSGTITIDAEKNIFFFNINDDKTKRTTNFLRSLVNQSDWSATEINFKFQEPPRRIAQIAELRIAYLLLFARLGYGFILNQVYEPVRQQIRNPNTEVLPTFGVLNPIEVNHPDGVFMVTDPEQFKGIFVKYTLHLENKHESRAVLLPGPGHDCLQFYNSIKGNVHNVHLKYTLIPIDISQINTSGDALIAVRKWLEIKSNRKGI